MGTKVDNKPVSYSQTLGMNTGFMPTIHPQSFEVDNLLVAFILVNDPLTKASNRYIR